MFNRRQQEINEERKKFGLTEEEIQKFHCSKPAKKAFENLKLSASQLKTKSKSELQEISLYLRLCLILENKSRAGEVRNMSISEVEQATPDVTAKNKLCFIVSVQKTKTKESYLFLTEQRKAQLDKFIWWVTIYKLT